MMRQQLTVLTKTWVYKARIVKNKNKNGAAIATVDIDVFNLYRVKFSNQILSALCYPTLLHLGHFSCIYGTNKRPQM